MSAEASTFDDTVAVNFARALPVEDDGLVALAEAVIRQRVRDAMATFKRVGTINADDPDVEDAGHWLAEFIALPPSTLARCVAAGIIKGMGDGNAAA